MFFFSFTSFFFFLTTIIQTVELQQDLNKNFSNQKFQKPETSHTCNPRFLQNSSRIKFSSRTIFKNHIFFSRNTTKFQLSICNFRLFYGWEFKVACGKMALCTNLNPIKIFFSGFKGGYGKMWIFNLRSEFLKHKITINDSKIEPWTTRSKNTNKNQEHDSRNNKKPEQETQELKPKFKKQLTELKTWNFFLFL